MNFILGILASYCLGAIPTAYIAGKLCKGIDIRWHGSGNVGATNVFRVLGKWPGVIVLVLDILKGTLAVTVVADFFGLTTTIGRLLLGAVVVIGHNWTVFLNFKGGKGIATSLGVLIGLTLKITVLRPVLGGAVMVWLIFFLASGFVSISSIAASVSLPILMVVTNQDIELIILGIIFCLFVVLRHRPNIKRLLFGQEPRAPLPFLKKK